MLLSGGLDSAVTLYMARAGGYECYGITFDYGQRHKIEIGSARKIAAAAGIKLSVVRLEMPWKGSTLFSGSGKVPVKRSMRRISNGIPSTYVPARNTVFLSIAVSYAEAISADAVFIGAHSEDSSGYPDCRVEYLRAFDYTVGLGTERGIKGKLRIISPIISMKKKEIVKIGVSLGVPFDRTWSCYNGLKAPCRVCDSCILRAKGFKEAGVKDPLLERYG